MWGAIAAAVTLGLPVLGVVALVRIASARRKREQLLHQVWHTVATERGASFHPAVKRMLSSKPPRIETDDRDARIVVDLVYGENYSGTRARVRFPLDLGPRYHVYDEHVLATVAKKLGAKDVIMGRDPGFDDAFVIKSDDVAALNAAWSDRAIGLMLSLPRPSARSNRKLLVVEVVEELVDATHLAALIDLAGELANVDIHRLSGLAARPEATYVPASGPWDDRSPPAVELRLGGAVVRVAPTRLGKQVVTRAEVHGARSDAPISVEVSGTTDVDTLNVPADARPHLARAGAGTLACEGGTASFTWTRLEGDADQLMAGARALATFAAGPSQGAFR